jgi:hypothetical protein
MFFSGLLSTMNIWVDKYEDIRLSINDLYMTLLMSGWMFLFMGLFYQEKLVLIIGVLLIVTNIWCIRTQFLVTEYQYKLSMIPHHSMAVHMSKRLLEKEKEKENDIQLQSFATNIINTQENEIKFMKTPIRYHRY